MMELHSSDPFRPLPHEDAVSSMEEETAGATYFENLQRDASEMLRETETKQADNATDFLYSQEEVNHFLELSKGESIGTIKKRISKEEINEYLQNVSDVEKQLWMQECDGMLDGISARPTSPSSEPLGRQAESIDRFGGEPDAESVWNFANGTVGVQVTAMHLYEDSASNRTLTETATPPPAVVDFAPREEQKADRTEVYQVFFRCKVTEILQQEELERTIAERMTLRLRKGVEDLNNGKTNSLQAVFNHNERTTKKCNEILKRISSISSAVATENLKNNPNQVVMSRNLTKCEECRKYFGMIVRRHHCRRCGRCLCNECCCCLGNLPIQNDPRDSNAVRVPEPERLCGTCYNTCLEAQQGFTDANEAKFYCQEKSLLQDGLPRFYAIPPGDYAAALSPAFAKITLDKATEGTVALVTSGAEYCAGIFSHWASYIQAQISQQPQQQQLIENHHNP